MATVTIAYAAKATITISPASVTTGNARQSAVIDNTATKYVDARIRVQSKSAASGTATLDLYVYSALGDTTYTDGATGSDAAFTTANRLNARYIGSIVMNAATAVQGEVPSVAQAFGGIMPDKWGLIVVNNSGATLSATAGDHVFEYEGITLTVA